MAKKVKQFRFYSTKNSKNYPSDLQFGGLTSGSAFGDYMPVTQLGIQALPGTKFILNKSNEPIIIGYTGIYELNLEGISEITSLQFEQKSLNVINNTPNACLIVDIIYEKDGD